VGAIIDPAIGCSSSILKEKIFFILLTHSHWDHIAEAEEIKNKTQAKIFIHKLDEGNLKKPGSDGLFFNLMAKGCFADHYLEDGEILEIGDLKIEILHTPGHTPGSCCFYLKNEKILFSGDTLFRGTYGRVDFPTSSEKSMKSSLKRLAKLPFDTKVYPGHGEETTIGKEKWLVDL